MGRKRWSHIYSKRVFSPTRFGEPAARPGFPWNMNEHSRSQSRTLCGTVCALLIAGVAHAATLFVTPNFNSGFRFSPTNLNINVGDTVVWTNLANAHTVTGNSQPDSFCGSSPVSSCVATFNAPGTFGYRCIPHASTMVGTIVVNSSAVPPGVAISSPTKGSLFITPTNVMIAASVTPGSGAVTNVQFFANGVSIGSDATAPYSTNSANLPEGSHTLTARATDSQGLSATSPPILIRAVTAPRIAAMRGTAGPIQFTFATITGVTYSVQSATTALTNWSTIRATSGSGTPQQFSQFSETNPSAPLRVYRLLLQSQ
jgi:plastocyanin